MLGAVIVCAIVLVVFYVVAANRRAASVMGSRPHRILSFAVPMPPAEAFEAVARAAQAGGYNIDATDHAKGQAVLSSGASLTNFGFFYPVFVTPRDGGGSLVEIGIKSKAFQWGPIVGSNHRRCFNGIKAALEPSA